MALEPLLLIPTVLSGFWFGRWIGALVGSLGVLLLVAVSGGWSNDALSYGLVEVVVGAWIYAGVGYLVGWMMEEHRRAVANEATARTAERKLEMLVERERRARLIAEEAQERAHQLATFAVQAEETERRLIAEGLHDDAVQMLLAAAQDLAEARDGDTSRLEPATEAVTATIDRLRQVVFDLHPVTVKRADLSTALRTMAERQAARAGCEIQVRVDADVDDQHSGILLSAGRELLRNAAKHAAADQVLVNVARADSSVVLEVIDDGRGMPPSRPEQALREGHIGLAATALRVEAVGGHLEVVPGRNRGTIARVVLPAISPVG